MNQLRSVCGLKYARLQDIENISGTDTYAVVKFNPGKDFQRIPIVPASASYTVSTSRTVNGVKYQFKLDCAVREIPEQKENLIIAIELSENSPSIYYLMGEKDFPVRFTIDQQNTPYLSINYESTRNLRLLMANS